MVTEVVRSVAQRHPGDMQQALTCLSPEVAAQLHAILA